MLPDGGSPHVRETPRGFRRRTGASYQPPGWLLAEGRPLAPIEACPTLFRYPGPCGLSDFFGGGLARLGPVPDGTLWMSATRAHADVSGVGRFVTLVVLQPLRLSPCRTSRRGIYVGVNRRLRREHVTWLPPSALRARLPWDRITSASEAREPLERYVRRDEARIREELGRYVEELQLLERAGAVPSDRPWCDVPIARRRRTLARHGVTPTWSVPAPRATALR